MNKQLQSLMQKEMTRKEFLAAVGVGILGLLGFSSVLHFLTNKNDSQLNGYGSRSYGGRK